MFNLSVRSLSCRERYSPHPSLLLPPPDRAIRSSCAVASIMRLLGGLSGPPISRSRSVGETYIVPESHCILEMVGRGGITAAGLISLSCSFKLPLPVPHTGITTSSEGPAQPTTDPVAATMLLVDRVPSSIGNKALLISFSPGRLKARTVRSPKVATMAKPCSSNSVTAAASQRMLSKDLEAPLEEAGLKMRISVWVTALWRLAGTNWEKALKKEDTCQQQAHR